MSSQKLYQDSQKYSVPRGSRKKRSIRTFACELTNDTLMLPWIPDAHESGGKNDTRYHLYNIIYAKRKDIIP